MYNTGCLGTKEQQRIKILLKKVDRSAAKCCIWSLISSKLLDMVEKQRRKNILYTLDTSAAWDMDINQMDGISTPDAQDYRNM